jgi:alpha-L-arabinofuranosidase
LVVNYHQKYAASRNLLILKCSPPSAPEPFNEIAIVTKHCFHVTHPLWAMALCSGLLVNTAAVAGTADVSVNVLSNLSTVASTAYGIHASIYANQLGNAGLTNQLAQSRVKMIRYPGGGLADVFHWSVSRPALGSARGFGLSPWFGVTNSFGYMGPKTDFGSFAQLLTNGQFEAIITVNYGSGLKYGSVGHTNLVVPTTNAEPPEAAAWVAYANATTNIFGTGSDVTLGVDSLGNDWKTAGYWAMMRAAAPLATDDGYNFLRLKRPAPLGIRHWEIGNETFGTGYYSAGTDGYSVNYALPYPHTNTTRLGNTNLSPAFYGRKVRDFSLLMKAVDPSIKVGAVVSTPPGDYSWDIYNGQRWTSQVLAQCATNIDFVIAHWYPYAGALSDGASLLAAVPATLPLMINGIGSHTGTSAGLRDSINAAGADLTNVDIFITEFGYNGSVTNALNGEPIFGPVNSLYAADACATWMELGVANADWLELSKNTFLGDSNPLVPGAVFYATQLCSRMAVPGDNLLKATSDVSQLRVHAAARQDGKLGLMLLNQNPTNNLTVNVNVQNTNLTASGVKYVFGTNNFVGSSQTPSSAPSSNAVSGLANSFSVSVPAYTMVVLTIPFATPTNTPPVLAALGNRTVNVGQTVSFTASATDTESPPQKLTFTLLTSPTNATLNTDSGAFSFRPLVTQSNTTNLFTLRVADDGSPSLTATQSFFVVVNPLTQASLSLALSSGLAPTLTFTGSLGPDYAIQASTNLTEWQTIFTTNSPALPFNWTDSHSLNLPMDFYRVLVGPPLP